MPLPNKSRLIVLGGGAIGSAIAAALSEKFKKNPWLIGRKDHVALINQRGLLLKGQFQGTYRFTAGEAVDFPLNDSLLLVTTKATDLERSLRSLRPFFQETTSLLLLQNGYGIKRLVTGLLSETAVLSKNIHRGIVELGATFMEPGEVVFFGGQVQLEENFAHSEYGDLFASTFIPARFLPCLKPAIWKKLLVNSVVNPLSVLLQASNRTIAEKKIDALKQPLITECQQVAAAEGVDLDMTVDDLNHYLQSDNISSMLQDFKKKRKTEIDFINGAIVKLGIKHHIPTPIHSLLVQLIKASEKLYAP